jgi:hypothetical protein
LDLSNLEIQEGAWLTLLHPTTGLPTDIRIHLAGIDSQRYRDFERKVSNRRLKQAFRRGGPRHVVTREELDEEAIDLLVACTLGWENMVEAGKEQECTSENAKRIYTEYTWIREQVDAFIGDRSNFLSN